MMRVVFMGTPGLAATVLEALAEAHEVVGVLTRPDAIRGRGKKLMASPVKMAAEALGIEVHTPKSLKNRDAIELISALDPDVICVAAYGAILPPAVLAAPKHGCLNVHTSLLPRWRGAAPIERAILARDEQTGVCIMKMEEELDTGPYCVRKQTDVACKYLHELAAELSVLGAEALLEALDQVEANAAVWTPQSQEGISYASKIEKGELDVDPSQPAEQIVANVRASSDSHPCRLELASRRIAIERARVLEDEHTLSIVGALAPGAAVLVAKRLLIGTCDGLVELEQVKPEGKRSMEGRAFAAGIQGIKNTQANWGRA